MRERAFEIIGDPKAGGPFVFTCEHASNDLHGLTATPADRALVDDHWGWDIGAADLVRALCTRFGSAGVMSRFSRLLCDPNRPTTATSYIVTVADGHALSFNSGIDDDEIRRRTRLLYQPFHDAVDRTVRARKEREDEVRLVSIHSFTPEWDGEARPMEIGVLFDDHEAEARDLASAIERAGFAVALNEPYSGRTGLIYSVQRHGRENSLHHVELEVRNDLLRTQADVDDVADKLAVALQVYRPPNA
jgi:predicted N-formylglutamate amidohydrolase